MWRESLILPVRKERSLGSWGPPASLKKEAASPPPLNTCSNHRATGARGGLASLRGRVFALGTALTLLFSRFPSRTLTCQMTPSARVSSLFTRKSHRSPSFPQGTATDELFFIFVPTGSSTNAPNTPYIFLSLKMLLCFFSGYCPFP